MLKSLPFGVICCAFLLNICFAENTGPIVTTIHGKLQGRENLSRDGRKFDSYLGIPYGKADRWEQSTPFPNWNGTRDALKLGDSCAQYDIFTGKVYGVEDCLFLNVFVPKIANKSEPLPVMLYIHGGGYAGGTSSDFGPKYFMDEDVILVTINYRVHVFGLTDTGFGSNFGLRDQILALKWVQNNIEKFGGNKNSVTIFGESAGGISVALHLLSPLSKGLFHKAISQSGTPHNPLIPVAENPTEFVKLGHLMGCSNDTIMETQTRQELLDCLKKVDPILIVTTTLNALKIPEYPHDKIPNPVVTVDKENGEKAFLPDYPVNLLAKGEYPAIPWVTGAVAFEGFVALLVHPGIQALWKYGPDERYWNAIAPKAFSYDVEDTITSEAILHQYFETKEPETIHANMSKLLSDYTFIHPAKSSAILHAKYAPTYLYYFSLPGNASYFNELNPPNPDGLRTPAHGDELQYLFNYPSLFPKIEAGSKYADFSDQMVKLWVTFAKNGNFSTDDSNPSEWTPLNSTVTSADDIEWYHMDTESKMAPESSIFESRLTFWDTLFHKPAEVAAEGGDTVIIT